VNSKFKQLTAVFKEQGIDAFLVTKDVNIRYLTGFPASESWLLVCPRNVFYITDFRYILEAKKGLKDVAVVRYEKSIFETTLQLSRSQKVKALGFDERHLSLSTFRKLKQSFGNKVKLKGADHLVEDLREIKTKDEIVKIRKALALHHQAHKFLKTVVKPGLTEREVFRRLERFVKDRQAGFSFDPIIASGPNSCLPHGKVTDRKIRNNEPVLVDMGIDLDGYKSDLTRMFFLGRMARQIHEVNEIVKVAQQKAIEKIRCGLKACEIDQEARNHISRNKLGEFFGHSLGHGVGLEIHEAPSISSKSSSLIKENMIFTVEPAVYIPNKFGIRIEDMVLVTKSDCEVLSHVIH